VGRVRKKKRTKRWGKSVDRRNTEDLNPRGDGLSKYQWPTPENWEEKRTADLVDPYFKKKKPRETGKGRKKGQKKRRGGPRTGFALAIQDTTNQVGQRDTGDR